MATTHALKLYKKQPDGSLKLVETTWVPDLPRPCLDFGNLEWRNIADCERNERDCRAFEHLVDAACGREA